MGFYFWYFLIHLPIALLIDATICIPREYQFSIQQTLYDFHVAVNHDIIVASRPPWMQAFVWVELIFQVPFFVYAIFQLGRNRRIDLPMLVYSVEAATTTLGAIAEIMVSPLLNSSHQLRLLSLYLPTLIIPLYMMRDCYSRLSLQLRKVKEY